MPEAISEHKPETVTRRAFLKRGAVAGALAAGASAAAAPALSAAPALAEEPGEWADEADYVILGTGGAGLSAAATCGLEGLGSCLILEAAPYDLRGGNSRCCGNSTFVPSDVEGAMTYQANLNLPYEVEPELLHAWAENIAQNADWLTDEIGVEGTWSQQAEFPEVEGSEAAGIYKPAHQGWDPDSDGGMIWAALEAAVEDFDTPVYYETRAVRLVADPAAREVRGVVAEDGRRFKARKAVILACGGFEWNAEMMDERNTCGFKGVRGIGTPYNRGDGIVMAQRLGAALWHMNNFSGKSFGVRQGPEEWMVASLKFAEEQHDYIFLDPSGRRFMYEESRGLGRHGKVYEGGTWADIRVPGGSHAVFGQASYDALSVAGTIGFCPSNPHIEKWTTNDELLENGVISRSETVAELAEAIGCDEEALQASLDRYNAGVAAGADEEFGRGEPLAEGGVQGEEAQNRGTSAVELEGFGLVPIEPPYYSVEIQPYVLNSQGGCKRDASGQVVDIDGEPIPRLFAAGENGTVYAYLYNRGGNFSEAISSGRLAMRSASKLEPWE